jgi:hypothetical protein
MTPSGGRHNQHVRAGPKKNAPALRRDSAGHARVRLPGSRATSLTLHVFWRSRLTDARTGGLRRVCWEIRAESRSPDSAFTGGADAGLRDSVRKGALDRGGMDLDWHVEMFGASSC